MLGPQAEGWALEGVMERAVVVKVAALVLVLDRMRMPSRQEGELQ